MTAADIVRTQVLLTDPRFIPVYRAARDKVIGPVPPASTLLVVALWPIPNS